MKNKLTWEDVKKQEEAKKRKYVYEAQKKKEEQYKKEGHLHGLQDDCECFLI